MHHVSFALLTAHRKPAGTALALGPSGHTTGTGVLKITANSTTTCVTLKLEGKLLEPWLGDLREAHERAQAIGQALLLDLADVSFIDAAGERAVSAMLRDGVTLVGCSSFVAELLQVSQP
jgi:anti-anti-sigma regulatory factor